MSDESIAADPSEDNGNVPLDREDTPAPPPSDPPAPANPAAPTEPVEPAPAADPAEPPASEPVLYELPDGRKVDGETLTKEWKENFLPEFTRKSQIIASLDKPPTINTPPANPLEDPEYTPKTYAELAEQIRIDIEAKAALKEKQAADDRAALEARVESQLSEVKKSNPTVNESALFLHATKYGFSDLRLAHQNMRDMADTIKKTQDTTVKNIAKRTDPVSVTPGGTGARPDPSAFATAKDYLRSLNK